VQNEKQICTKNGMSWTRINPEEKETLFRSEATEDLKIAEDLKIVVDRMIGDREEDNATASNQLFFFINATNGFIQIVWWDNDSSKPVGDWVYELELTTFWESEDDAFNFDSVCRYALFDFTEDNMIFDDGSARYEVFMKTELSDIEEVLI
jgi:hypothetical protein